MVVFPNIKINIGLSVTGKRPDGYHNIESVMIPVPWTETLEVTDRSPNPMTSPISSGKVDFYSYGQFIPGEVQSNLCIRIFHLLEEWFNLPRVDIHLLKTLPIGAGLGGGSADAAFCLRALKEFFDLTLSDLEAEQLLSKIGSDCPFFWDNKPVFAFGTGNEMRPINLDLFGTWITIIHPKINISTKEAYEGIVPKPSVIDLELLPSLPMDSWKDVIVNDFEHSLFPTYPVLPSIKSELYDQGATYASMSGSGSAIYGLFNTKPPITPQTWSDFTVWQGQL
jgi:4-diphosphocytidyl-2-C-methyl-D-erythritol kinase